MLASQNPFRRSKIARLRYQISDQNIQALIDRFQKSHCIGAILGPHGTGKSTLLEDLQLKLNSRGYITRHRRIHEGISRQEKRALFADILNGDNSVFFLDGGENLGFASWFWLVCQVRMKGCRLLATTHKVSLLPTLHKTEVNKRLMLELTRLLADEHWDKCLENLALDIYQRYRGNMREVFRACYIALM